MGQDRGRRALEACPRINCCSDYRQSKLEHLLISSARELIRTSPVYQCNAFRCGMVFLGQAASTATTDLGQETGSTPSPFVDVHLQPVLQPLRYVSLPKQRVTPSL